MKSGEPSKNGATKQKYFWEAGNYSDSNIVFLNTTDNGNCAIFVI